jgi:hypothetical protein
MAREQSPKISDPIFAGLVEGENILFGAQKSSGKPTASFKFSRRVGAMNGTSSKTRLAKSLTT